MFRLPQLPYAHGALAPVISEKTMRLHHGKHHAKYVETTNALVAKSGKSFESLEAVVRHAAEAKDAKLFNNAGQAWNHAFFWCCMAPGQSQPSEALAKPIQQAFGGLDRLKAAFVREGAAHFGSGWVWLVADGAALSVTTTHDGDSALLGKATPLLVCDLWEHAYYLDHQNDREGFLNSFWDQLVDWRFVSAQFDAARGRHDRWCYADAEAIERVGA